MISFYPQIETDDDTITEIIFIVDRRFNVLRVAALFLIFFLVEAWAVHASTNVKMPSNFFFEVYLSIRSSTVCATLQCLY